MNNPFTLIVQLKQHSPLIHFQHDQAGATLRATELKPKLDKFLFKHVFKDFQVYKNYLSEFEEEKYKNLKGPEKKTYEDTIHKSLAYKVKIHSPEVRVDEIKHSLFFGNIGRKDNTIKSVSISNLEDITMEITCFRNGLLAEIESNLPSFFASSNFGTRQDKGFGSYYLSDKDQAIYKDITSILPESTPYIEINSTEDSIVFSTISYYYRRLKSGINPSYGSECKPGYQKAYLYKYLDEKHDYTWEKRWIKETFFGLVPDGRKKKFARALMGLPGSFSFLATNEPCNPDEKKVKVNKSEIEVSHDEIARIQSPLTFKIIKYFNKRITRVFILLNTELIEKISKEICNRSITFGFNLKYPKKSGSISVPDKMINFVELLKSYHDKELKNEISAFFEKKDLKAKIKTIGRNEK